MSKELFHKTYSNFIPKEINENWEEIHEEGGAVKSYYQKERLIIKILNSLTFEESKYNELKISFMYILYEEKPGYVEIQCEIKGYK
jgi:hypothetical protein